ncbi:aminodeoxychorismate lyase [Thalassotalea piscium]|uniref:Aminodeoxychorismate lyase n=1 Tax=Thalassotalea piscium TaxID=1230533 RepID=A0A7X0NF30_9GAMM|nr:aminodeoxychorismate lyase [Thalassotalea piscium]MBB6542121.1 4-amino-4-deoxychorismate lyase [Thalassotalea piscium]
MLYFSVNGIQTTDLSINDRGLSYGDGFFTTAKIFNGRIEFQQCHIERLKKASKVLSIAPLNFDKINKDITELALSYSLAVIKIVITAGKGGRGYARPESLTPSIIISIFDFPSHYKQWQQQGISLGIAQAKLGLNPLLQGIKHLNRLEQVLIRAELDQSIFDELLVCDFNNNIIEVSSANIFWKIDSCWFTANVGSAGVNGVIRQQILALFPDVKVVSSPVNILDEASTMFVCNSVMGIVPIRSFNQRRLIDDSQIFIQRLRTACD